MPPHSPSLLLLPVRGSSPVRTRSASRLSLADGDTCPSPKRDTLAVLGREELSITGCNHPEDDPCRTPWPPPSRSGARPRGSFVPRADTGVRGGVRRAASASPPTPCDLRYRVLLARTASPRLCQHAAKPAAKGTGKGGEARRERSLILRQRLQILVGQRSGRSCSRCR